MLVRLGLQLRSDASARMSLSPRCDARLACKTDLCTSCEFIYVKRAKLKSFVNCSSCNVRALETRRSAIKWCRCAFGNNETTAALHTAKACQKCAKDALNIVGYSGVAGWPQTHNIFFFLYFKVYCAVLSFPELRKTVPIPNVSDTKWRSDAGLCFSLWGLDWAHKHQIGCSINLDPLLRHLSHLEE